MISRGELLGSCQSDQFGLVPRSADESRVDRAPRGARIGSRLDVTTSAIQLTVGLLR